MNRSDVWLIFRREVRDQIRDRRTLFMILVLPLLLYPMLGIGIASLSTAFEQKPRTVVIVGSTRLPANPPLLDAEHKQFDAKLFDGPGDAERLKVKLGEGSATWSDPNGRREALRRGEADAVLVVPDGLDADLEAAKTAEFTIAYDSADERGPVAYHRVRDVVQNWGDAVVRARLERDGKPPGYNHALAVKGADVATLKQQGASVWARMFPFLLVTMALTGAFYPAIDLCAGEKERGTMETLLITPAGRGAIVLGKFLTVMLASAATALLNLLSMGLTGLQLGRQIGASAATGLGPVFQAPSLESAAWMVLVLVPLSALFAALSVALALLARSMKEGQYYMTPLYMATLPLTLLALAPGVELTLATALLPIAGASLLLRSLIQGDYALARLYVLPVLLPTLALTALALRWAVDQFRGEEVLFRDSEKFEPAAWLRHLLRHKPPTPSVGGALLCFALMVTSAYYIATSLGSSSLRAMALGQVVFILGIPLALAVLFTSRPTLTFRLAWPSVRYIALGIGLALALNPFVTELGHWVQHVFPLSDTVRRALAGLTSQIPDLGIAILLFAVVPAVCEEAAFRGFILTGLQRGYPDRPAILISAFLFGFLHALISLPQQFLNAALLGIILGLLAVRSRSLWPGVAFHVVNNSLAVGLGELTTRPSLQPLAKALFRVPAENLYQYHWLAIGGLAALAMLIPILRPFPPPVPHSSREPQI